MTLSAVFAAVRLISQVIGMLPINVYAAKEEGGKRPALTNPAYRLLKWEPNPWMTSKNFRQLMEVHRLLWGNAYAEIVWSFGGSAKELWPIEPWRVKPVEEDGELKYSIDNGKYFIAKEDMLHIPLISFDGITGQSFIDFAINSLGLNLSAQDFAATFFGNGATHGSILMHEGDPNKEQRKEVREEWEKRHVGPGKGYRTGVLWGGWQIKDAGGVDPEKSQLIEQRRFGIEEVARWLNIPPHLLRDLSQAKFNNIEESQIDAVIYSWLPILVDYEQEYDRRLLNPPHTFCKHNLNGLLRGNMQARAQFYKEMFAVGGITINKMLELEDEDPIGPMGDLRFVPLNMQTLEEADKKAKGQTPVEPKVEPEPEEEIEPEEETEETEQDEPTEAPKLAEHAWLKSVLGRMLNKELNALKRAASKPKEFLTWLDEFYPHHTETLSEAMLQVVDFIKPANGTLKDFCNQETNWAKEQLLNLSGNHAPADFPSAIEKLSEEWRNTRVDQSLSRWNGVEHALT